MDHGQLGLASTVELTLILSFSKALFLNTGVLGILRGAQYMEILLVLTT